METPAQETQTPSPPQPARRFDDAAWFVWGCWLAMSLVALLFVARYSRNVPFWDEFSMVGVVSHHQPVTLDWLWSQHNEHRIPLPRLIYLSLAALTNSDFRAGMYFSLGLISLLAACLLIGAKRIRGYYRYSDAFLPVVLMNLGNFENLLWSFQIAFAVSTFLICVILLLLVSRKSQPVQSDGNLPFGPVILAGLCMVLLPLCGAQGTIMVPALAIWLGLAGLSTFRRDKSQGARALAAIAVSLLACVVIACYFLTGYAAPEQHLAPPSIWAWVKTSVNFLLVGFGPTIRDCGVYGMSAVGIFSVMVLGSLALAWKRQPAERWALMGIVLFFAGMLALAAAIGKGRAFLGEQAGLSSRYGWLAVPFTIGLYLAIGRWGSSSMSRFVQTGLLLLAALVFVTNIREGQAYAETRLVHNRAILVQVRTDPAPQSISVEAGGRIYPDREFMLEKMQMMREAEIGPWYRRI